MNTVLKRDFPGIGDRVRARRRSLGLSLQVAATRGATTPQTWAQLERHDLATTRTLNNIARALEISVDTLTGRKAGQP